MMRSAFSFEKKLSDNQTSDVLSFHDDSTKEKIKVMIILRITLEEISTHEFWLWNNSRYRVELIYPDSFQ